MDPYPELRTLLHTPDRTHQLWAHTISMSAAQMHTARALSSEARPSERGEEGCGRTAVGPDLRRLLAVPPDRQHVCTQPPAVRHPRRLRQQLGAAHSPGLRCAGTRSSSTMSVLKGSRPEHLPVSERVRSIVSGQGGSKDSACHEQDSPFVGHVYGSGFCDTRMRQRGGSVRTRERGVGVRKGSCATHGVAPRMVLRHCCYGARCYGAPELGEMKGRTMAQVEPAGIVPFET